MWKKPDERTDTESSTLRRNMKVSQEVKKRMKEVIPENQRLKIKVMHKGDGFRVEVFTVDDSGNTVLYFDPIILTDSGGTLIIDNLNVSPDVSLSDT